MNQFVVAILAIVLLSAGCCSSVEEVSRETNQPLLVPNASNVSGQQPSGGTAGTNATPGGNGTIIEAPSGPGGQTTPPSGGVAYSQADCATLTPTCDACLAKQNCGWCKSSNSCFIGTSNGPSVSSCPAADWTFTTAECSAPAGGGSCASQTNCVSCLSGSECKWCIQGSKCAGASSTDDCFGGWLNVSYQCNFASR